MFLALILTSSVGLAQKQLAPSSLNDGRTNFSEGAPTLKESLIIGTGDNTGFRDAPLDIAILTSDGAGNDFSEITAALLAEGVGSITEILVEPTQPLISDLLEYDACIFGLNNFLTTATADEVGDNLADYIDAGGKLIMTSPSNATGFPELPIGGRFLSEGYFPVTTTGVVNGPLSLGTYNAAHPIMAGVTTSSGNLSVGCLATADADLVAVWSDGSAYVATKGSVVQVNVFIATSGAVSGQVPLVIYNALNYLQNTGGGDFTVYLNDSNGNPLGGGYLEFQDGGWQTATEVSTGVFDVNTTKTNVNLKMTFNQAPMYVTVPTSTPYTFQTELVTFELRKRTGALGYNWGEVSYVGFGDPLGYTGPDGLGRLQRELLPREYTFRMKFRGGMGDITQDISVDPVVTWTMARMLVQVNKSDGERGINGVAIQYKGYALETFGTTGTHENGRARKDLLPGFYKFTLKYAGGKLVVEDFEVVPGDNELIIDAQAVTVELLDDLSSSGSYPVDGGDVRNGDVSWNAFGTTGDDGTGTGSVTHDLLPLVYSFDMEYDGDSDEQLDVDCTSGPVLVTFYTSSLKSSMVSANEIDLAAYPNPFAGNTTFAFELDRDQYISMDVYDMTGKMVDQLYDGNMTEGSHKMQWDANDINSGLYIIRLTTETSSYTQRVVKN